MNHDANHRHPWLAERAQAFDSSGIRKVFDLARSLRDPINLSIGQPDFDVPQPVRQACIDAIEDGRNGYALSQGMPVLLDKLQEQVDREYGHDDRRAFVASGTSGGLLLALLTLVNPGDEVIFFDPFFVMYEPHVRLAGGIPRVIDTYPSFHCPVDRVADSMNDRTKAIVLNSPSNPTGVVAGESELRAIAELAAERGVALISDEIYRHFCFDEPFVSPARFNDQTIVIDGFSKSHAMTGWRVGFVHGPGALIDEMVKLQQYTFVCAPQPAQWAAAVALETSVEDHVNAYRSKRDRLVAGLRDHYELEVPGGAFYLFPRAPQGTGTEFVNRAIQEEQLLMIPGGIFSRRDTHFRISYAATDETLDRAIAALQRLAG